MRSHCHTFFLGLSRVCLHILRIYFAERPLREHHLSVLDMTKDRKENIQMQAGWANKSFAVVISQILGNLHDMEILKRCRLHEKPLEQETLKAATEDCQAFFRLCVATASQRAWTMMVHRVCQPDSWLGVLDEELELRRESFANLREDVDVITTAWEHLQNEDTSVDLKARENEPTLFSKLISKVFLKRSTLDNVFSPPTPTPTSLQGLATLFGDLWFHRLTICQDCQLSKIVFY